MEITDQIARSSAGVFGDVLASANRCLEMSPRAGLNLRHAKFCHSSLARHLRHRVGIGHTWRDSSVAGSHRSHVARSVAGDASAGCHSKLRWTIAAAEAGRRSRTMRLNREKFAGRILRDADGHPGHVIGKVERALVLTRPERTIAGGLGLVGGGVRVETSAVGSGRSRVIH